MIRRAIEAHKVRYWSKKAAKASLAEWRARTALALRSQGDIFNDNVSHHTSGRDFSSRLRMLRERAAQGGEIDVGERKLALKGSDYCRYVYQRHRYLENEYAKLLSMEQSLIPLVEKLPRLPETGHPSCSTRDLLFWAAHDGRAKVWGVEAPEGLSDIGVRVRRGDGGPSFSVVYERRSVGSRPTQRTEHEVPISEEGLKLMGQYFAEKRRLLRVELDDMDEAVYNEIRAVE